MRRVDKSIVLASLEAQGVIEQLAEELHTLAEYELWRAAFERGSATLDGLSIEQVSMGAYAQRSAQRRQHIPQAGKRQRGAR